MEYYIIGLIAIIGVPLFILVAFMLHAWKARKKEASKPIILTKGTSANVQHGLITTETLGKIEVLWLTIHLRPQDFMSDNNIEHCYYDRLNNEVFKLRYYNSDRQLVDVLENSGNYHLDTYSYNKLRSKLARLYENDGSVLPLHPYSHYISIQITGLLNECFGIDIEDFQKQQKLINNTELYQELLKLYRMNQSIRNRFELIASGISTLLLSEVQALTSADLKLLGIWDFQLERFPLVQKPKHKEKLLTKGNLIALGIAILLVYLMYEYVLHRQ